MKLFVKHKHILPIILTIILGSLSHFFYEWSGQNPFVALVSPINESTWEHLKLLFFPFFLFSVLEYILTNPSHRNYEAFFTARYIGVVSGMLSIVVLFYAYTGIIGTHLLFVDILLFIIGVITAYTVSTYIYEHQLFAANPLAVFLAWFLTLLFFFIFTAFPPEVQLFFSPTE